MFDIDGCSLPCCQTRPQQNLPCWCSAGAAEAYGRERGFLAEITAFVNKAKTNQEAVVRAVGIKILNQLVVMSPVGNPELWEIVSDSRFL